MKLTITYIKRLSYLATAIFLTMASMVSCISDMDDEMNLEHFGPGATPEGERLPSPETRHVAIVYSMGYNDLVYALKDDIDDICKGEYLPTDKRNDNMLLVFNHSSASSNNFTTKTSPVLIRIYRDMAGKTVRDTVKVWPEDMVTASGESVREVLEFIHEEYPAKSYGLLMSSHATGWSPKGYCKNPSNYEKYGYAAARKRESSYLPMKEFLEDGVTPLVKSMGAHYVTSTADTREIDINELAANIPMKLEYMIFDACFMGCVEVAYQLKDVCRKVVFSQTEILSYGMDYLSMMKHLLQGSDPDLKGICDSFYDMYINQSTPYYRSGTISLIDCENMKELADCCRRLSGKYRTSIITMRHMGKIPQKYWRSDNHDLFYDLKDIFRTAGATTSELTELQAALDKAVIHKKATAQFMGIVIRYHSGLSMYLPHSGSRRLNEFYKSLEWNKDTELVTP